jgi:hypothetical protein
MLQQGLGWVLEELAHETRRRPGEPVRGSVGVMLDHASNGAGGVRHPQQILNLVKDDEAAALRALIEAWLEARAGAGARSRRARCVRSAAAL